MRRADQGQPGGDELSATLPIGTLSGHEVSPLGKHGNSGIGFQAVTSRAMILALGIAISLFVALGNVCIVPPVAAQTAPANATLPSETPARFQPVTDSFDYVKRDVMIPMRDGVKLHTVIVMPKGAKHAPILLTRTPYNANACKSATPHSSHLGPILDGYDNATEVIVEGGYIRVMQDVRGKYGSEGDYVMTRPLHGPLNPTPVDHSTDTYDTIDWLVKNVPESNGKVGILGISYDGFLPLMALVNPHPALKVSVPMNPMVDGWMGDDWFHNGAFRAAEHAVHLRSGGDARQRREVVDRPLRRLRRVHGGRFGGRTRAAARAGAGRLLAQAARASELRRILAATRPWTRILAAQPLKVPVMLVDSLWDQEDIYGATARLQSDQAEGHEQRQGLSGDGPLASRAGDRRRQHAGRLEIRQRYRSSTSAARFCGRFSINI